MNENIVATTLHVLSNKKAFDHQTASLTTNGGLGVGKNMYVQEDIIARDIIARNNIKADGNLYINGELQCNSVMIDTDNIIFKKNILTTKNITLGTNDKRCSGIYTHILDTSKLISYDINTINLEITNSIKIGLTFNNQPILEINSNDNDIVMLNGDFASFDINNNPLFRIDAKQQHIYVDTDIDMTNIANINKACFNLISMSSRTINVNIATTQIFIQSSLIFLFIDDELNHIINLISNDVEENTIIKIVLIGKINPVNNNFITINSYNLSKKDDYVEFIFIENNFIYIGGNIRNN